MRRAVVILVALAALTALIPGHASSAAQRMGLINAIGIIDFGNRPDFKVGSWVTYHVVAHNDSAVIADYRMKVLIAGEEHWWGEDCFWVETVTTNSDSTRAGIASLMSYDVFQDSLALQHMQFYMRKTVNKLDAQGRPVQEVFKRPTSTLHEREPMTPKFGLQIDTLGIDTVRTPRGEFICKKVKFFQGRGQTGASSDSSDYTELSETRLTSMAGRVPITHIVREEIHQVLTRKAWKIGHSKDATPTVTLDNTIGVATLVDYGSNGKSEIFPASMQKSLAELEAERKRPPGRAGAAKPRSTTRRPG